MMDVPGSYLLWLFKQPWIRDWPDLHDYLVSNQTVLMAEEEDDGPTDGFQTYQDYETYGR